METFNRQQRDAYRGALIYSVHSLCTGGVIPAVEPAGNEEPPEQTFYAYLAQRRAEAEEEGVCPPSMPGNF